MASKNPKDTETCLVAQPSARQLKQRYKRRIQKTLKQTCMFNGLSVEARDLMKKNPKDTETLGQDAAQSVEHVGY